MIILYNPVFDGAFKTILRKMPKLVIPMINEVFGTDYSYDEKIINLANEHQEENGKNVSDTVLEIKKHLYHFEYQSYKDNTMAIRMIEYDFSIALDNAAFVDGVYEMKFPKSAVIYIRQTKSTPDTLQVRVTFPDDSIHLYSIPTVKIQSYSKEEIFEKDLLMALPFFILKYENRLKAFERNHNLSKEGFKEDFLSEYEDILKRLEKAKITAESEVLYNDLINVMKQVADYVLRKHKDLQEGIDSVMASVLFDLPSDKLREQFAEGKAEGELKRAIEVYNRCLESGMSKEEALRISGLPEDKIPND